MIERLQIWILEKTGLKLEAAGGGVYWTDKPPDWPPSALVFSFSRVIVFDRQFKSLLTDKEFEALLAHERAHQELGHHREMSWTNLFRPSKKKAVIERQELEADAAAARGGIGYEMKSVLEMFKGIPGVDRELIERRIAVLETSCLEQG